MTPVSRQALGMLSAGGVGGAHLISYLTSEPYWRLSSRFVLSSNHDHLNYLLVGLVAACVWGLVLSVTGRASTDRAQPPLRVAAWSLTRLAPLHLLGILMIELLESAYSGADSHGLVFEPAVIASVGIALLVAGVVALLLGVIAAAIDLIGAGWGRAVFALRSDHARFAVPAAVTSLSGPSLDACGLRGPPTRRTRPS